MRLRFAVALLAVVAGASQTGSAQWLNHPTPGTPRLPDGKPNLSGRAPRVNGKPDLSGVWQAEGGPIPDLMRLLPGGQNGLGEDIPSKYFLSVLADFKSDDDALQPSAPRRPNAVFNPRRDDPGLNCFPSGMPMSDLLPAPFKIVQSPRLTMVLYEADTTFRQIFVDGRKHPDDPQPTWMGYSTGRWEGDCPGRGHDWIQRPWLAGRHRAHPQRRPPCRRTVSAPRLRPHERRDDARRSEDIRPADKNDIRPAAA